MSLFLQVFKEQGPEKFSSMIGDVAPYFATIDPEFVALEPGFAEIRLKNQKKVQSQMLYLILTNY